MGKDRKKRVGVKRSNKVDWLSNLPESLLYKVLLNLDTKDVVRTSVLSKRWRNLWRYVPGLDLSDVDFRDYKTFVSFVDDFLGFNSEAYLESFKLNYDGSIGKHDEDLEFGLVSRWIKTVVDRKVKHLYVDDYSDWNWDIPTPPNLSTCGSLVYLKLYGVPLACPKFVSLPCLKFMDLTIAYIVNALDLEKLISACPVLESLIIEKIFYDGIEVVRVCSQSLLRFTYVFDGYRNSVEDDLVVEINAPRLQYLRLGDEHIGSLILNNTCSLVEAHIDTVFNWSFRNEFENDLLKRKMISSFLKGVSCVKNMTITSKTLELIYHYSKCEQLPLFRNLFFLHVSFPKCRWKMMPIFLESCPNLKSLVVVSDTHKEKKGPSILSRPRGLLSSLEFVDIETPLRRRTREMKLVSYFLEKSSTLKKLTLRLDAYMWREEIETILKELLSIPRLSSSCQVVVL